MPRKIFFILALYPWMPKDFLLEEGAIPAAWRGDWSRASIDHF